MEHQRLFSKKHRVFFVFLFLIVFFAGLSAYIGTLILEKEPFAVEQKIPNQRILEKTFSKLGISLKKIDKDSVISSLSRLLFSPVHKLYLSSEEVNALLDLCVFNLNSRQEKIYGFTLADFYFQEGAFTAKLVRKVEYNIPFGKYLNITLVFKPEIKNNNLKLDLLMIQIGREKLPVSICNWIASSFVTKWKDTKEAKELLKIINTFKVYDEKIYCEYKLREFIRFLYARQ